MPNKPHPHPPPLTALRHEGRGTGPRLPWYSAAYYAYLGSAPTGTDPTQARTYYRAICHQLDKGGWTRSEWTGLRRLEQRWRRRVDGQDARWALFGAKAGRLVKELEDALRPAVSPEWAMPLSGEDVPDPEGEGE